MTKETGSNEPVVNGGMKTRIVVVDGADGMTPDMLRTNEPDRSSWWDSEIGYVTCSSCGARWVCHFAPWLGGGQDCRRCGTHDSLEWEAQ